MDTKPDSPKPSAAKAGDASDDAPKAPAPKVADGAEDAPTPSVQPETVRYNRHVDDSIAARLRAFFAAQAAEGGGAADLDAVYLFGSEARGTARPDSDVDVGVLARVARPGTLDALHLDLEGELERALDGRTVQVVPLASAPVDLIHRVLRDGVLVWEGSRSRRIAFEVRARAEYFDLQPYLAEYRRHGS